MAKPVKKQAAKKQATKKQATKKQVGKKRPGKVAAPKAPPAGKAKRKGKQVAPAPEQRPPPPLAIGAGPQVLDRLWAVVTGRRDADPALSHSARLLSRGTAKIAQKFGEEAVECLIEATLGNRDAMVAESADVLYHMLVMWVDAGIRPDEVWTELHRREGISGIAEKASRARKLPVRLGLQTTKIP